MSHPPPAERPSSILPDPGAHHPNVRARQPLPSTAGTLRVALFTGAYNHIRDGVSLTLNRLVSYLEREGVRVIVFAPTIEHPPVRHAGTLVSVPSVRAPGRPEYRLSLGLSRHARRALAELRPTLVHIATPDLLGLQALRWGRRRGIPVVASWHTHFASYLDYYGLGRLEASAWRYLRWFYGRCAHVYVPTSTMADVLRAHGVAENSRCWPRGVDTARFAPAHRSIEWRRSIGTASGRGLSASTGGDRSRMTGGAGDEPIVTFVSRLVAEKGVGVVADVLEELRRRGIPHRAVIVGDGPARTMLAERAPHAHFTGTLEGEALARAYASSDIFLFPSETETFGNVTLEAMASGLPVVAADAPGSASLVGHGETGFLAPARRGDVFSDHVARLAGDAALRARLGANARERALRHDWEPVLGRLLGYYRELA